jgi:hypothetical protein
MNPQISVGEVKDLHDGTFSVRLNLDTKSSDAAISHSEIVSADGSDAAIQTAKTAFLRWLQHVFEFAAKHPKPAHGSR